MRQRESLPRALVDPDPSRLPADAPGRSTILKLHREAVAKRQAFYADPATGRWVLTAPKLWEGDCCDNGCRHCPWVRIEERLGDDA